MKQRQNTLKHDILQTEIKRKTLKTKNIATLLRGGLKKIKKQHALGKLTAQERIDLLFDSETFIELDRFRKNKHKSSTSQKNHSGDGVITGFGFINRRQVFIYSQDFTVFGGTLSETHAKKICKIYDMALKVGAPVIGLIDSGGARIQEGVASLAGYAKIFCKNTLMSGVVPQISIIMGPAAGGAVYSPALTDFILMVEDTSYMFLTGPEVIKSVTHEIVNMKELGGANTHNAKSGVAHFSCSSDYNAIELLKKLLSYLPSNNAEDPPIKNLNDIINRQENKLKYIIPSKRNKPYNIKSIIELIVDKQEFIEIHKYFAKNIVIVLARIMGQSVGIIGNQPEVLAGAIDINASDKASRFVRFCDCFNIPIITLVDVPGFLPGTSQEFDGIIRHGAKLLYAYSEAVVPKITIILRKAYGGAYCVMGAKNLRADLNFALPSAEIAVMGAQEAVNIIMKKEIAKSKDKNKLLKEVIANYDKKFQNPYEAAELGYIDEVILPESIRPRLYQALISLKNKKDFIPQKKHGNIPL